MSPPLSEGLRRVGLALSAYLVLAVVIWWLVGPIRRVFLLPEMFVSGTRLALIVVVPLVAATAWRYPHLGSPAEPPEPDA